MFLLRFLESVELEIVDYRDNFTKKVSLETNSIQSVGFQTDEKLATYPLNVFDGYVLLQEYFAYQDKFLFLDLFNVDKLNTLGKDLLQNIRSFTIHFHFSKRLKSDALPTKDNFSLYCTPAINLFETESVPIRKSETQNEYLVVPADI